MSRSLELPGSRRRRLPAACTAALVTTLAAPATAQLGGKESLGSSGPAVESSSERSSERLRHRDRLVTDGDFEELAPESPAPPVQRPDAPRPEAAPGPKTRAVKPPATHDEVPPHTPEWTNPGGSDPGRTKLDREGGAVRFGDGERGRRLPSGSRVPEPQYRPGQGRSGSLPGRPEALPSKSPGTGQPGMRGPSLGQQSGGDTGLKAPGGLGEPLVPKAPSNADEVRRQIEEARPPETRARRIITKEEADRNCARGIWDCDSDGDGHRAAEYHGDDCDDDDANTFPGNAEVADMRGHDEDCDPSTIDSGTKLHAASGDGDKDKDTFIDERVANYGRGHHVPEGDEYVSTYYRGRPYYHGTDCDDSDPAVHPQQIEVRNGRDDNCNGEVDEGLR